MRERQVRLRQLDWYTGSISGTYSSSTVKAVKGFQHKRGLPLTGKVDDRTWSRLVAMTRTPTAEAKHNRAPKASANGLTSAA